MNTKDWIVIPKEFSKLENTLSVNPKRLSVNDKVSKFGKEFKIKLRNTTTDLCGNEYIGNIYWTLGIELNLTLGYKTLNPNEFFSFLKLLDKGSKGVFDVFTESKEKLEKNYLEKIKNDILIGDDLKRGEFLDGFIEQENSKLYLKSNHILNKNSCIPIHTYSKPLSKNIRELDSTFSLDSLFKTKTKEGFPSMKTEKGEIYYWAPNSSGSVLGFTADYRGAYFDTSLAYLDRNDSLGIRSARNLD